jgi:hypothetical protein
MRAFTIQLFFRAIKDWRTYTGIIALIFAMTGSFTGHAILLPTWLWWAGAVLSVGAIAVQAEWKLHQERSSSILPDMRLVDLAKRIVGSDDLFVGENCSKCGDALLTIRENAHLGKIAVWGRKNVGSSDLALYPLTSIPAEYWDEFGIDYLHFTDDQNGKSERVRGEKKSERVASTIMTTIHIVETPDTIYSDLWLCAHQVEKSWPSSKRQLTWQWPFRFH